MDARPSIPSVDKLLRELGPTEVPRPAVVAVVRRELAAVREQISESGEASVPCPLVPDVLARVRAALKDLRLAKIQPVVNGTGILIHTNLGRAPLGKGVVDTLGEIAANYNNLEYDLADGLRGGRAGYLEHNLAILCGAEAATVVNNNAAALVLVLRHFTRPQRPQVVISRGELVQIGGGFRIPEILQASGASLCEVGTTNQTSLEDYANAIVEQTAMVLKVHRSNFYMEGFVDSPRTGQIASVARERGIPFVEDLGSGAMGRTEDVLGVEHEPTPAEVLAAGADLVCFSGDKLLGGPQAGIIAGRSNLVAALKREPFFRALRCDKLILAALQTTVDLHLNGDAGSIPVLDMMRLSTKCLRERAERIVAGLAGAPVGASVGTGEAQIGGGTLPRSVLPSVTVDLWPAASESLEALAAALREGRPPLIGYIKGGSFKIDLRTVFPRQDELVMSVIREAIGRTGGVCAIDHT